MLRGIGAALVLGGALWTGWQAARELSRRVRTLRTLTDGLSWLERELSFRLSPLGPLLWKLGERTEGAAGAFFRRCARAAQESNGEFSDEWRAAAETLLGFLPGRAVDSLTRLGEGIGRYDWREEQKLLSLTLEELRAVQAETAAESARQSRLYRTLSAAVGAALVVLLI